MIFGFLFFSIKNPKTDNDSAVSFVNFGNYVPILQKKNFDHPVRKYHIKLKPGFYFLLTKYYAPLHLQTN